MRLIEPIPMTDAILTFSNVTEADYPAWSSATAYSIGDRVIKTSTHRVYQAATAHTNRDPEIPANAADWLLVSATNRWKAFDGKIGDPVIRAANITYRLTPAQLADGFAAFGLKGDTLSISITDSIDGLVYSNVFDLIDDTAVIDWFTYFYEPFRLRTEVLLTGLPLYSTGYIDLVVASASGNAEVGEVVIGRNYQVGDTKAGSSIGIRDFSTKEEDDFGNIELVERAYAQTVGFEVAFPANDSRRVFQLLARNRARPAVYHDEMGSEGFGTLVYGFYGGTGSGLEIDLIANSVAYARIEIEGLV